MIKLTDHCGGLSLILDDRRTLDAAFSRPECGEVDRPGPTIGKSSNSNTLGLEILECPGNIKETLATTANNSNRSPSQLGKVRGDIHRVFASAVNTSEATSAEDFDTCKMCENHSACYGRPPGEFALVGA